MSSERQEDDRIDWVKLAIIGVTAAIVFGLSLGAAGLLLRSGGLEPRDERWSAPTMGEDRSEAVDPRGLVTNTKQGLEVKRAQRAQLDRWEWVDRDGGVAAIPIERAIDIAAKDPRLVERTSRAP